MTSFPVGRECLVQLPALAKKSPAVASGARGSDAPLLPGIGFLADGQNGYVDTPPPVLGPRTAEVLREIGLDDREIKRLVEAGVAAMPLSPPETTR